MPRSTIDNVLVNVDSNNYITDGVSVSTSVNSFTINVTPPVKRVKEIIIDSMVFNNGVYNVNNDEISIPVEVNRSTGIPDGNVNTIYTALIEQGTKTHGNSFADDISNSMSFPIATMTGEFSTLDENRYLFNTAEDVNDNLINIIWYYSEVLNKIGAVDNVLFYMSFISEEELKLPELIEIDETNDTLVLESPATLTSGTSSYTLTLPHTNYTIYNIVYALNEFINDNGLSTGDKNTKDVEYYSFSDKIIIRTNKSSGSTGSFVSSRQWHITDTPLSQLLKLDDTLTKWVYVSDDKVDPDVTFELLDYSSFLSNRASEDINATIPIGIYTSIEDIVTAINTEFAAIAPAPALPYTISYDTLTRKTTLEVGGSAAAMTITKTGLAILLGLSIDGTGVTISETNEDYVMPNISTLHRKYLFIKSDAISRIRANVPTSNVIYKIPLSLDSIIYSDNTNQQKIILPNVANIDLLDFTLLQEDYKIANNNGGSYTIIMNFITE